MQLILELLKRLFEAGVTLNSEVNYLKDLTDQGVKAHGVFFPDTPSTLGRRIIRTYKANEYEEVSGHFEGTSWVDETGLKASTIVQSCIVQTTAKGSVASIDELPTDAAVGDQYTITTTEVGEGGTETEVTTTYTWNGVEWKTGFTTAVPRRNESGFVYTKGFGPNGDTTNSFDSIMPWGGFRRVNLKWTSPDGNTSEDSWFIRIPKFYYYRKRTTMTFPKTGEEAITETGDLILISDRKLPEFNVHPMFMNNDNTEEVDFYYVSAYEGYSKTINSVAYMLSQPNVTATRSITRAVYQTRAKNLNNGSVVGIDVSNGCFEQYTAEAHMGVLLLFLVEFANRSAQAVIADNSTGSSCPKTGASDLIGETSSGVLLSGSVTGGEWYSNYGSGSLSDTASVISMAYRGIDQYYASIWKFVGDLIKKYDATNGHELYTQHDRRKFVVDGSLARDNLADAGYVKVDTTIPNSGWVTTTSNSEDSTDNWVLFPSAVGGSATTYYGDYFYNSTPAESSVYGGGSSYYGSNDGPVYWGVNVGVGYSSVGIGGRLTVRTS